MNHVVLGLLCGLVFGLLDVLIMIPLSFENSRKKIEAMSAAGIERFMIGFLIPTSVLPLPPAALGLLLGLLLSIPSAIITRAYIPILATGGIGGVLCGVVLMWLG